MRLDIDNLFYVKLGVVIDNWIVQLETRFNDFNVRFSSRAQLFNFTWLSFKGHNLILTILIFIHEKNKTLAVFKHLCSDFFQVLYVHSKH